MIRRNVDRPAPVRIVHCAVYTRKSTEEGLEQEFNSLDAQRESAEAYIASQAHEGWQCLPEAYDDGGFTGGNMDRPALKRLMADIGAGLIDTVVVPAVGQAYGPGWVYLTVGMSISYLGALAGEDAVAEGWIEQRGRSIVFCAADVTSASGARVATGTLTYTVQSSDLPGPLVDTVTGVGVTPLSKQVKGQGSATVALNEPIPPATLYLPIIAR